MRHRLKAVLTPYPAEHPDLVPPPDLTPVSGVNYFSLSTTTIFPYRLNLPFAFCSPPAAAGR
jgi:hypothetical protein